MTALAAIYTALAAMPVALNGVIVPVRSYDALPASVPAAEVPLRLLMPIGTRPGGAVAAVSFAGLASADWRIADLLLLRPAQAGRLETAAADLVEYTAAYADALNRTRQLAGAFIQGAAVEMGVYTYPAGGSAQWFGVEITLDVRETYR